MGVADERRLRRLSRLAERQYLEDLAEMRQQYVTGQEKAGIDGAQAALEFDRELCKRDLYFLTKFVLGYSDLEFHLHKGMAESMENLPAGARELREFPRGAFKSTIMTIGFCVQQVLINPEVTILVKSNSDDNASKKLEEMKRHFSDDKTKLGRLFPAMMSIRAGQRGSGSWWRCPAATRATSEGTLEASGVGSTKTGNHYDMIIGDDFWDQKSVQSKELSDKTQDDIAGLKWLMANQETGRVIFVGTRFSHDDPTDQLIKAGYHAIVVSSLTPSGRALFPSRASLGTQRQHVIEGGIYDFSCQSMLNPTRDDRGFRREWFKYTGFEAIKAGASENKLSYRTVVLTDSTITDKSTSDPIALLAIVIDSTGRKTVVDYVREHMDPSVFIQTTCAFWDKWKPDFCVRQLVGIETQLQPFFEEENKRREKDGKTRVRFYPYSLHKRDKKTRITVSLQPRFCRGEIHFDPDLPHLNELEKELLDHPDSQNDDGIDALAMLDDDGVSRVPDHLVEKHRMTTEEVAAEVKAKAQANAMPEAERLHRQKRAQEYLMQARKPQRIPMGMVGRVAR